MIAAVVAVFALASCTPEEAPSNNNNAGGKLATPVLSKTQTETSFTITWDAVTNAESYIVNFDGVNKSVTERSFTVENLNAGTYTVRVKAQAKGREDSDSAKIDVTLTGLTEADWFNQQLFLDEYADEGVTKFNSIWFTWKGTGIADIKYGLFLTSDVEQATDDAIKAKLNSFAADQISYVLEYVNSAEGFTSYIGPGLNGLTQYTLCTLVKNADGIEFMEKTNITTEEAVLTDGVKRWLGTYSAQTAKMVNINSSPVAITDEVTNFEFSVVAVDGTADLVDIYGLSLLTADLPAFGYVLSQDGSDYLCVMACQAVAEVGDGWYAYWMPFCEVPGGYTFVTGEFIAYAFAMDAAGNITYQAGNGELGDGTKFSVVAMDLLAFNGEKLGILADNSGADFVNWKYGEISNVVKKAEASAAALNTQAANLSVSKVLPASVVIAM